MGKKKLIPNKLSPTGYVVSEKDSRASVMSQARYYGYEQEAKQIFEKYDKALAKCTNPKERAHIAACGAAELHTLIGCRGSLEVDGKLVIPPKE